jgi:hypothetical protein
MNTWVRSSGSPAATHRSQNPDTMADSGVPARPAWVSYSANSVKEASFIWRLYRAFVAARGAPRKRCGRLPDAGDRRAQQNECALRA